jgi:acetolactate synthase-1/2/3 large subunit
MSSEERPLTVADVLVRRLRDHGIRHIFGYPGGQLTPIYDALYRQSDIRHILARDEQAAAFMADGYARATGKPGICLAVCGPGVFNAATALATSFTDSIPMLCVSGQVPKHGLRTGYYHENEQMEACATFTKQRIRVEEPNKLLLEVDRGLGIATSCRQGPVLLEIALNVLRSGIDLAGVLPPPAGYFTKRRDDWVEEWPVDVKQFESEWQALAAEITQWKKPLLIAGGGVVSSGSDQELATVAYALGAPVLHTLMGKCAIQSDHSHAAGLMWHRATSDVSNMDECFSPLFKETDGVLAIGCRFSQAATGSWQLRLPKNLIHIDIDPNEIGRHYPVSRRITADAKQALALLARRLPKEPRPPWAKLPVQREPWQSIPGRELVSPLRRALPRDAIIAADITRLSYVLLAEFPVYTPRSFLHPAGFVPMGYGIPAAIGAKAAFSERTVVAVVGDGCFMMSGMELASMMQEKLPVIVVLVNDNCLTLIKSTQARKYENRFIGVDLVNPDFGKFAAAFGVNYWGVETDAAFEKALNEAVASKEAALIEVKVG